MAGLISEVDGFQLRKPTFVSASQAFRIDHDSHAMCVDRGGGHISRHDFVRVCGET